MGKIVAFYGAGGKSLLAERILRQYRPELQAKYLVENKSFAKVGTTMPRQDGAGSPLEVISLEKLKTLYNAGECHQVIIPASYHISDLREISRHCSAIGIARNDIMAVPFNRLKAPLEVDADAIPPLVVFDDLLQISQMDVHVVDHCNLSCKACGHFSNLVEDKVIYDAAALDRSLEKFSQLVPNVCSITLLGGEPLLHPELNRIIESARRYFPYAGMALATNGILLEKMSEDLKSAIRNNDVTMVATLYPPLYSRIDKVIQWFRKENLRHSIIKVEEFEQRLFKKPLFDKNKMFVKCGHDMCLRGDHFGYCVLALFADYFNKHYGKKILPEDAGLDIFSYQDGASFLKALHQPLELCRYCVGCDAGRQYFSEWQLTDKNPSMDDWFIKNLSE